MHQNFTIFLKNLNKIFLLQKTSYAIKVNINQALGNLEVSIPSVPGVDDLIKKLGQEATLKGDNLSFSIELYDPQAQEQNFSLTMFINELWRFVRFFCFSTKLEIDSTEFIQISSVPSLWRKDPSETTSTECEQFYSDFFLKSDVSPPWVFIKTYEPLEAEGIVYLRKHNLYEGFQSSQGFILLAEQAPVENAYILNLLPQFIRESHAIVEIKGMTFEELSSLTNSKNIEKLVEGIIINIAESIRRLNRKHREHYEVMWPSLCSFVKKGCLQSKAFDHIMRPHILYKTSSGKLVTMDEYLKLSSQENLENPIIPYFDWQCFNNDNKKYSLSLGIDPIYLENHVDYLFLQHDEFELHRERKPVRFLSAEASCLNHASQEKEPKNNFDVFIKDYFKNKLGVSKEFANSELTIISKDLGSSGPALLLVIKENSRRFYYESVILAPQASLPIKADLVINTQSPVLKGLEKLAEPQKSERLDLMYLMATQHLWRDICPLMILDT